MLVANISTPLLGIIDAAILGHLDDSVYLAAAALGAQLVTLVFWSLGFLRMATTGFTARALGEGNKTEIDGLLIQGLRFALIASAVILLINPLLSPLIVKLMATEQELFQLSLQYTELRFWSAPATLTNYVMIVRTHRDVRHENSGRRMGHIGQ